MFKILIILFATLSTILALDGKVIKVADGDTITVLTKNKEQIKVRLFGIDAPERKQDFGTKATNFLSSMVAGKNVEILEKGKDKYKRILGIVTLNGRDINKQMVLNGYAWSYKKEKLYFKEQMEAKNKKIGLWVDKNPVEPYLFRKK